MSPQYKFEAIKIFGSKQASSSLLEVKSNRLNLRPFPRYEPTNRLLASARYLCAQVSRSHSLNTAVCSSHVLVHLVLGCNYMATLLVARHCQDSGLTEIEPCCSALIASVEFLYSYVSMLQREESPGGLSTSLTPTVAPCAAPRLLSHLTLCQPAQSTVQRRDCAIRFWYFHSISHKLQCS